MMGIWHHAQTIVDPLVVCADGTTLMVLQMSCADWVQHNNTTGTTTRTKHTCDVTHSSNFGGVFAAALCSIWQHVHINDGRREDQELWGLRQVQGDWCRGVWGVCQWVLPIPVWILANSCPASGCCWCPLHTHIAHRWRSNHRC